MAQEVYKFEIRTRCPVCKIERSLITTYVRNTPAALDALEKEIDKRGGFKALCPKCGAVEQVAFFANNRQTEDWMDADEYERLNGEGGGPLPPKPWGDK